MTSISSFGTKPSQIIFMRGTCFCSTRGCRVRTGARAVQRRSQDGGSSSSSSSSSPSSSPSSPSSSSSSSSPSSRSAASVGIYGGGAAGLAAAYFAAQNPDLAVTVYEKTGEVGRKIKVRSIDPSMTDDE